MSAARFYIDHFIFKLPNMEVSNATINFDISLFTLSGCLELHNHFLSCFLSLANLGGKGYSSLAQQKLSSSAYPARISIQVCSVRSGS